MLKIQVLKLDFLLRSRTQVGSTRPGLAKTRTGTLGPGFYFQYPARAWTQPKLGPTWDFSITNLSYSKRIWSFISLKKINIEI